MEREGDDPFRLGSLNAFALHERDVLLPSCLPQSRIDVASAP